MQEHSFLFKIFTKQFVLILLLLLNSFFLRAQIAGDYRSKQSGVWSTAANWETYNGSTWVTAIAFPTNLNGVITILNSHSMSVASTLNIDQCIIQASGSVIVSGVATQLFVENGAGTDLELNGLLRLDAGGAINMISGSALIVNNGGVYQHNRSFVDGLPAGGNTTWNNGSKCLITSDITSATTLANHAFNILEIDYAAGTTARVFDADWPTSIDSLVIKNTGTTGTLSIANSSNSRNRTVNNFIQHGGRFYIAGTAANGNPASYSLTVTNNFIQHGGEFEINRSNNNSLNATYALNVNGSATLNGGIFRLMNNSGTGGSIASATIDGDLNIQGGSLDLSAIGTINGGRLFVKSNLNLSSGEMKFTQAIATGSSGVYFIGAGIQSFNWSGGDLQTGSGGIGRRFFYKNVSGPTGFNEQYSSSLAQATINGTQGTPLTGHVSWPTSGTLIKDVVIQNPSGVTLSTNKVINNSLSLNSGIFTLSNTLTMANATTIYRSGGSLNTAPTFGSSIHVTYNQHGSNIVSGPELPTNTSILSNLTMNTSNGVTLSSAQTMNGVLYLQSGNIATTNINLLTIANSATSAINGGSTSSFVAGPLSRNLNANLATGDYFFPVGVSTTYLPFTIQNVNTGAVQPLIKVEAVQANSGGSIGSGLVSLSQTEYWVASFTGNFLNGNISMGRQSNLAPLNVIARSSSLTGQYDDLNGTVAGNTVTNSDNTSTSLGYFLFAEKGCTSPSLDAKYNDEQSKTICDGELFSLTANAVGGVGCTGTWEYAWYTGTGTDATYWNGSTWTNNETWGAYETITNVAPTTTTTYKIKVRCTSNYSCTNADILGVTVTVNSSALPSVAGAYTSSLTQNDGTTRFYADGSCNSLVLIQDPANGSGLGLTSCATTLTSNPIIGQNNTLNGQVYLPRYFEISPSNSESAFITFYLAQSDFNTYNAGNGSLFDLPTSGSNSDPAIANLRLAKILNGDLTSGTFSYPTITSNWNSTNNRWEITANTDINGKYYFFTDPVCNQIINGFVAGTTTSTTAALSWNNNAAALNYDIRIRPIGTNTWNISNGWTSLNATMTGLAPSTTYEAQLKVRCSATTSGLFSPSIFFTTLASTVCPIPTGFATNTVTSNSVNVVWNSMNSPVATYILRFKPTGNSTWMNAGVQGVNKQLNNLAPATNYEVQIASWCPALQKLSSWSNSIFFTTSVSCTAPSNLNVTSVLTNSAILNWNNIQGALGYVARWRPVGNTLWSQGGGLNNPRFIHGLTASTLYEVQVSTWCSDGSLSSFSNLVQFTTASLRNENSQEQPTEILHEQASQQVLNLFPNPGNSIYNIQLPHDWKLSNTLIRVIDMNGKIILTKESQNVQEKIDMTAVSSGMYFLLAINGNQKAKVIFRHK